MDNHHAEVPRRSFFVRTVAACVGGVVGLVPILAGLAFLCDPLLRRKQAGSDDFLRCRSARTRYRRTVRLNPPR